MQKSRASRSSAAGGLTPSFLPLPGATPPAQTAPRGRGRPRKTPGELDDDNCRREIIDGAARLFRSKGFAAASTRDIAAAAGMRSGSPFYHFESKSALLHVGAR